MQDQGWQAEIEGAAQFSPTLRELAAPLFRRRRLAATSFLIIFLGAILIALLLPTEYQAQMKILVKRERVDPMVTPDEKAATQPRADVTEEELNSEVELLRGRDLLEKVVLACNPRPSRWDSIWGELFGGFQNDSTAALAKRDRQMSLAVRGLEKHLRVETIKKTNLIEVTYDSPDPQLAARVLTSLAGLYLDKHLAVHRPPGAFDFFHQEAERYREQLASAEKRQEDTGRGEGVFSAQLEKEIVVRKLADFDAGLQETQAAVAETQKRIQDLQAQLVATSPRRTTQIRTSDNSTLLQELKSTLLSLELKRTDLLDKFEPTYRPVREIEQQIAQTRAAIESAEQAPIRENTTDPDPTHDWLRAELAKSRADLAALQARATATAGVVRAYRQKAELLDQQGTVQEDLRRDIKAAEENYLLYLHKQEEARISDALDRRRILNVAIAEAPMVPSLPSRSPWLPALLLGGLLGGLVSLGLAYTADYLDPSLRTPDELRAVLNLPVLAAVPKEFPVAGNRALPGAAARTAAATAIVLGLFSYSAARGFREREFIRPILIAAKAGLRATAPRVVVPAKLVLASDAVGGSGAVGKRVSPNPVRALAVVGAGETLQQICVRYLGRYDSQVLEQVTALNPQVKNLDEIKAGDWLWLPWDSGPSGPMTASRNQQ